MANDIRLIDANELKKWFEMYGHVGEESVPYDVIVADIEAQPTIDAELVVHGRWIRRGHKNECDQCGFFYYSTRADYRRCPKCEAKMDLKETHHEISV